MFFGSSSRALDLAARALLGARKKLRKVPRNGRLGVP